MCAWVARFSLTVSMFLLFVIAQRPDAFLKNNMNRLKRIKKSPWIKSAKLPRPRDTYDKLRPKMGPTPRPHSTLAWAVCLPSKHVCSVCSR